MGAREVESDMKSTVVADCMQYKTFDLYNLGKPNPDKAELII